jgi:hypothetical protein
MISDQRCGQTSTVAALAAQSEMNGAYDSIDGRPVDIVMAFGLAPEFTLSLLKPAVTSALKTRSEVQRWRPVPGLAAPRARNIRIRPASGLRGFGLAFAARIPASVCDYASLPRGVMRCIMARILTVLTLGKWRGRSTPRAMT